MEGDVRVRYSEKTESMLCPWAPCSISQVQKDHTMLSQAECIGRGSHASIRYHFAGASDAFETVAYRIMSPQEAGVEADDQQPPLPHSCKLMSLDL